MSVLLRHPATVPALFSRAADPESPAPAGRPSAWRRAARGLPLLLAAATLAELPLAKAAAAAVGLALPR